MRATLRQRLLRRSVACYFAAMTFIVPAIAWAQDEEVDAEPAQKWLLSYCLVGLLIGLSMYSMCRPSVRRKKD